MCCVQFGCLGPEAAGHVYMSGDRLLCLVPRIGPGLGLYVHDTKIKVKKINKSNHKTAPFLILYITLIAASAKQ